MKNNFTELDVFSSIAKLLQASHFATPENIPELLNEAARGLGADRAVCYLADYAQKRLYPLVSQEGEGARQPFSIDGTIGGRSFVLVKPLR